MGEPFQPSDEDLPSIFWKESGEDSYFEKRCPHGYIPGDCEVCIQQTKSVAIQVHFPAVLQEKSTEQVRREEKALARDRRESATVDKAQYIKIGKKSQMYSWLLTLEWAFPGMDFREREFCEKLLAKFRKYTVQYSKFITRKQYDWLKSLSEKYICIPKR